MIISSVLREEQNSLILKTVDSKSFPKLLKVLFILFRLPYLSVLKKRIEKKSGMQVKLFSVYPSIESPAMIFEQNKSAYKHYVENFLPKEKSTLKKVISFFSNLHLALDSFIFVHDSDYKKEIEKLLGQSAYPDFGTFSSLEIVTSNSLIIFFDERGTPLFVARSGDNAALENHARKKAIYLDNKSLFVEPYDSFELAPNRYLMLEGVSSGYSWFNAVTQLGYDRIRESSKKAILNFNAHISSLYKPTQILAKVQLLNAFSNAKQYFLTDSDMQERIGAFIDNLDEKFYFCRPSHGDFCINNLIFENDNAIVVDLEDFEKFNFPLFDEISLSLSLSNLAAREKKIASDFKSLLNNYYYISNVDEADAERVDEQDFHIAYVYFVLTRFGAWSVPERRKKHCRFLLKHLDESGVV